jgi:hypothetical protein
MENSKKSKKIASEFGKAGQGYLGQGFIQTKPRKSRSFCKQMFLLSRLNIIFVQGGV